MRESKKPLFSVIVPVYNTEAYLEQCMESLTEQTFKDFEVILIDDGSTDRSSQICDRYQKKYENIKVIHKKNGGLVSARERGIQEACGQYVGYVDADDWVDIRLLEQVKKVVDDYEPDMITFNPILEFSNRSEKKILTVEVGIYDKEKMKTDIYPFMLYNKKEKFYNFGIYPAVWNKFIKRDLILKNRCTDYRITMGEDAACTYCNVLDAESLYIMPQYLYHYRQNEASMTNTYDAERFIKYKLLLDYMDHVLDTDHYEMKRQLEAHKAFRVKHVILNESKAPVSFAEKRKNLKEKMEQFEFDSAFDKFTDAKAGAATKIFMYFARKRNYTGLLLICEIFKKLHRY